MQELYFEIKKDEPIILYGLGTTGKKVLGIMRRCGFEKIFLVDQRAEQIVEYENNKVYLPKEMAVQDWKGYPVLIGIHDSWQHDEVMKFLLEMGYNKFIAIPMDMGDDVYKKLIRKIYNAILDGRIDEIREIPYFGYGENESQEIINLDAEYVSAWLASFFVFSATKKWGIEEYKDDFYYNKSDDILKTCVDICMLGGASYRLFECFINGEDRLENIGYSHVAERHTQFNNMAAANGFYGERRNLYDFYCRELEQGMSYFIDNPLTVGLNDSGNRFNIQDGHHRISFLMAKRYARIPVRMSRKDFEDIMITSKKIEPWCRKNAYPNILDDNFPLTAKYRDMAEFFYLCMDKKNWRDWKFLIYGDAFLAQHIQKEKADVTLVSRDAEVGKINGILNIDNLRVIAPDKVEKVGQQFDCVVLQNEKMEFEQEEIFRCLNRVCGRYLIWYSGECPETEKPRIESGITEDMHYVFGRYYFMGGIEYEWGFYGADALGEIII